MLLTKNSAITTVGNGTLLAAALLGQVISRSGPVGAFTDTLDSTSNIYAALAGLPAGTSFELQYINNSSSTGTIVAGDANTTVSGSNAIPATSTAQILFTLVAGGTITAQVLYRNANN